MYVHVCYYSPLVSEYIPTQIPNNADFDQWSATLKKPRPPEAPPSCSSTPNPGALLS